MKIENTGLLFCLFLFVLPLCSYSQETQIFENGTVLISYTGTFHGRNFEASHNAYDNYLLGVFYDDNEKIGGDPRRYIIPVKTKGITYAMCNSDNGAIKTGDPITSSSIIGEAMKATRSGMILGIALEDAKTETGLIKLRVMIQYVKQ